MWNGWDQKRRGQIESRATGDLERHSWPTWFDVLRGLGVGLLVAACQHGIAIWVIAREFRDMLRRVSVIEATAHLRGAGQTSMGTRSCSKEQMGNGSLFDEVVSRIVYRVVVQDQQAERKWASDSVWKPVRSEVDLTA